MQPLVYNATLGWNPYGFESAPKLEECEAKDQTDTSVTEPNHEADLSL